MAIKDDLTLSLLVVPGIQGIENREIVDNIENYLTRLFKIENDIYPPKITLDQSNFPDRTTIPLLKISGNITDTSELSETYISHNNAKIPFSISSDGKFFVDVLLKEGFNRLSVVALDKNENIAEFSIVNGIGRSIILDTKPPPIPKISVLTGTYPPPFDFKFKIFQTTTVPQADAANIEQSSLIQDEYTDSQVWYTVEKLTITEFKAGKKFPVKVVDPNDPSKRFIFKEPYTKSHNLYEQFGGNKIVLKDEGQYRINYISRDPLGNASAITSQIYTIDSNFVPDPIISVATGQYNSPLSVEIRWNSNYDTSSNFGIPKLYVTAIDHKGNYLTVSNVKIEPLNILLDPIILKNYVFEHQIGDTNPILLTFENNNPAEVLRIALSVIVKRTSFIGTTFLQSKLIIVNYDLKNNFVRFPNNGSELSKIKDGFAAQLKTLVGLNDYQSQRISSYLQGFIIERIEKLFAENINIFGAEINVAVKRYLVQDSEQLFITDIKNKITDAFTATNAEKIGGAFEDFIARNFKLINDTLKNKDLDKRNEWTSLFQLDRTKRTKPQFIAGLSTIQSLQDIGALLNTIGDGINIGFDAIKGFVDIAKVIVQALPAFTNPAITLINEAVTKIQNFIEGFFDSGGFLLALHPYIDKGTVDRELSGIDVITVGLARSFQLEEKFQNVAIQSFPHFQEDDVVTGFGIILALPSFSDFFSEGKKIFDLFGINFQDYFQPFAGIGDTSFLGLGNQNVTEKANFKFSYEFVDTKVFGFLDKYATKKDDKDTLKVKLKWEVPSDFVSGDLKLTITSKNITDVSSVVVENMKDKVIKSSKGILSNDVTIDLQVGKNYLFTFSVFDLSRQQEIPLGKMGQLKVNVQERVQLAFESPGKETLVDNLKGGKWFGYDIDNMLPIARIIPDSLNAFLGTVKTFLGVDSTTDEFFTKASAVIDSYLSTIKSQVDSFRGISQKFIKDFSLIFDSGSLFYKVLPPSKGGNKYYQEFMLSGLPELEGTFAYTFGIFFMAGMEDIQKSNFIINTIIKLLTGTFPMELGDSKTMWKKTKYGVAVSDFSTALEAKKRNLIALTKEVQ